MSAYINLQTEDKISISARQVNDVMFKLPLAYFLAALTGTDKYSTEKIREF